jgi:hypothetical protein
MRIRSRIIRRCVAEHIRRAAFAVEMMMASRGVRAAVRKQQQTPPT